MPLRLRSKIYVSIIILSRRSAPGRSSAGCPHSHDPDRRITLRSGGPLFAVFAHTPLISYDGPVRETTAQTVFRDGSRYERRRGIRSVLEWSQAPRSFSHCFSHVGRLPATSHHSPNALLHRLTAPARPVPFCHVCTHSLAYVRARWPAPQFCPQCYFFFHYYHFMGLRVVRLRVSSLTRS